MVCVMHERRRRVIIGFICLLMTALSACADEIELPANADPELRAGAEVYSARCSSCHGADGGGAIGPSLTGIDDRLDPAAIREVVVQGRRAMPSFSATLSEDDLDAVVRYTSEIFQP